MAAATKHNEQVDRCALRANFGECGILREGERQDDDLGKTQLELGHICQEGTLTRRARVAMRAVGTISPKKSFQKSSQSCRVSAMMSLAEDCDGGRREVAFATH